MPPTTVAAPTVPCFRCRTCGAAPPAGSRHRKCSACQTVRYCDRACQKAHYAAHKATCAQHVARGAASGRSAVDYNGDFKRTMAWYVALPNLGQIVACVAWMHRREGGVIVVEGAPGGDAAMLEEVAMKRRGEWAELGEETAAYFVDRFAQEDFNPDRHYYLRLDPYRPGNGTEEILPCPTPRMLYPYPPEEMDAWVGGGFADKLNLRLVDGEVRSGPAPLCALINFASNSST